MVVDVVVCDKLVGSNCFIFKNSLGAKCVGVGWPSAISVVVVVVVWCDCTRNGSQGDASFPKSRVILIFVYAIYAHILSIHSYRLLNGAIRKATINTTDLKIAIISFTYIGSDFPMNSVPDGKYKLLYQPILRQLPKSN